MNWERREKNVLDILSLIDDSARATIASGRIWFSKSDAEIPNLLRVEVKTTGRLNKRGEPIITIKKSWLEKILDETIRAGRGELPCLAVSHNRSCNYFILRDCDFDYVTDYLISLGNTCWSNIFETILTNKNKPVKTLSLREIDLYNSVFLDGKIGIGKIYFDPDDQDSYYTILNEFDFADLIGDYMTLLEE